MDYLPKILDDVLAVDEDDLVWSTDCQFNSPWHLQRISQTKPFQWNGVYKFPKGTAARNLVDVYVLDTFVERTHQDFQTNQVVRLFSNQLTTKNPHGTHVAGLIGSMTYGAHKGQKIFSLEVLDDTGYGTWSKLVEALSFISRHASNRSQRGIINISIGGGPSNVIDMVLRRLQQQGLFVVVAAGNDAEYACNYSPAREPSVFTVAATDYQDKLAGFSNYGKCVDILAPGDSIKSLLPNGQFGYMSGTSMSTPIVAGIASIVWTLNPTLTNEGLRRLMLAQSTENAVANVKGSPNFLARQPYGVCPKLLFNIQN